MMREEMKCACGEDTCARGGAAECKCKDFDRRMKRFVVYGNGLFAALTYCFYQQLLPLFPISFGLFFVFIILAVGLMIDEYILPVKTFREISKNAVAISLFWISIVFLAVSGVYIGVSIISDPFRGV